MKFIKDLLVFHVETSGQDLERDNILQLSAVLLDKDNLLEKNSFNSYVKVSFLDGTIKKHSEQLNLDFEILNKSPKITEVIKQFVKTFEYEPLLATHSVPDYLFLRQAFKKTFTPFNYNSHIVDIWSLGYVYTIHYGLNKIPTLTTLANHFNIPITKPNNALEKARISAEIFKRITKG